MPDVVEQHVCFEAVRAVDESRGRLGKQTAVKQVVLERVPDALAVRPKCNSQAQLAKMGLKRN